MDDGDASPGFRKRERRSRTRERAEGLPSPTARIQSNRQLRLRELSTGSASSTASGTHRRPAEHRSKRRPSGGGPSSAGDRRTALLNALSVIVLRRLRLVRLQITRPCPTTCSTCRGRRRARNHSDAPTDRPLRAPNVGDASKRCVLSSLVRVVIFIVLLSAFRASLVRRFPVEWDPCPHTSPCAMLAVTPFHQTQCDWHFLLLASANNFFWSVVMS